MIAAETRSADRAPWSAAHRVWFAVSFCFGIAFVFVLPPFQTNDEDSHWRRLWTLAEGNVYCRSIPEAATQLPDVVHYVGDHSAQHVFGYRYIEHGLEFRGYNIPTLAISTACGYFPLGYAPAAAVARAVALKSTHPRTGGMIEAYYAARITNWLLFSAVVFLLATGLGWMRQFTLFVYSVPGVLQQVVAINLDWFLMSMTALVLLSMYRPARIRNLLILALAVTLMTTTKPVYEPLVMVAAPLLVEFWCRRRIAWWGWIIVALIAVVPLVSFRMWVSSIPPDTQRGWGVPWINPAAQVAFLKEHPQQIFRLLWNQFWMTFERHRLIEGGWTSILGGFGWSAFEMPLAGYLLGLVACIAAVLGDLSSTALPSQVAADAPASARRVGWGVAVAAALAVIAGVIVGMYIYFTRVRSNTVLGVQGRYYHVPLWLLASMSIYAAKLHRRNRPNHRLSTLAACMGAAACAGANAFALFAIHRFYWGA